MNIEELFKLSRVFLNIYNRPYVRYFIKEHDLESRFSIIVGQRGVGKSTAMIQYLLSKYKDPFTEKAIFIQADHFLVNETTLYEIAESFSALNGKLICFDEIHKYAGWARELKSIYDTFPDLKIIASGSYALEIHKGSHDLSRRALVYRFHGLSFREFIGLHLGINLEKHSFANILGRHQQIADDIVSKLKGSGEKVLPLFKKYLAYGYYPYFLEYKNKSHFYLTLEQNIHTTIESDLPAINPNLSGGSIKKIKKLLSFIAAFVPFLPDLRKLKTMLDVGDERTLKTYLKYLEDAGLILSLTAGGGGMKGLEKPEKIYLNNFNQAYAIGGENNINIGNIRETFFINMLSAVGTVSFSKEGDFMVDRKFIFEVGGKNKSFKQIKQLKHSYLALDDLEIGIGNKIPLWLFGLLY